MKIGKKIKILRNNLSITGKELSEITGINHGLIRKYETTDCTPQYSHILKIANALNVRPYVLLDKDYEYKSETFGDLFGLLIKLNEIEFVTFSTYNTDIVMLEFNPSIEPFLTFRNKTDKIDLKVLNAIVSEKLQNNQNYSLFLQWVSSKNSFIEFKKSLANQNNLDSLIVLEEQIETLELKLQQSTEKL